MWGGRGGGGVSVNVLIHTFFYIDARNRYTAARKHIKHAATCDGVEDFFGKGGVHGVAMASNRNHPSSQPPTHTEVISGSLVEGDKGEE